MIIDIHTHMLTRDWLDTFLKHSGGKYSVGKVAGGNDAIFRGDTAFMTLTEGMFDYDSRIAAMDRAGVDVAVVSLTCPNVFWGGADVSSRTAMAMNDDMARAQGRHPERIRYLASIPWQYPKLALAELERACANGAVGVMVTANIDGASVTDATFAEIWAAIDERSLPVLLHPASPAGVEQMDMSRYHLVWSVGFTFDTTLALSRMIMDGFFDRHPRLKIIGGHAGGYLPFVISRLDAGYRAFESSRARINRLPSSYLKQIYVDSIVYAPETLAMTIQVMGEDNVLYGSDYPHKNGKMEEIVEYVQTLSQTQRTKVFSANALKIIKI